MNNKESEFVPLSEKLSNPLPQKNSIIKGNKIRNIQTKLINITDKERNRESITDEQSDTDSDNVYETESKIEPILEDNKIIGIAYTCRCGEESEIKFNVENETTENDIESATTENDIESEPTENDVESATTENDVESATTENDIESEPTENDVESETTENDIESEPTENDVESETIENDIESDDVESNTEEDTIIDK